MCVCVRTTSYSGGKRVLRCVRVGNIGSGRCTGDGGFMCSLWTVCCFCLELKEGGMGSGLACVRVWRASGSEATYHGPSLCACVYVYAGEGRFGVRAQRLRYV